MVKNKKISTRSRHIMFMMQTHHLTMCCSSGLSFPLWCGCTQCSLSPLLPTRRDFLPFLAVLLLSLVLLWLPSLIGISATQQSKTWQRICVFSFAWVHLVTNICTVLSSVGVGESVISFCSLVFKGCDRKESILVSLRAVSNHKHFLCTVQDC